MRDFVLIFGIIGVLGCGGMIGAALSGIYKDRLDDPNVRLLMKTLGWAVLFGFVMVLMISTRF